MPALEMAQDTGKIVRWLKREGEAVAKGEPIMEIETDKVTVEIEAPASGILGGMSAHAGDVVPVGETIAWLLAPGDKLPATPADASSTPVRELRAEDLIVSPVARRVAEEHGVDLALVQPQGKRIEKADVLAYVERRASTSPPRAVQSEGGGEPRQTVASLIPASPKARRAAAEKGIDLSGVRGSGPEGAIIAVDVPSALPTSARQQAGSAEAALAQASEAEAPSTVWRVMAERMTAAWTSVPHFYLVREAGAGSLIEMRSRLLPAIEKRHSVKLTFTDLMIKLLAITLLDHPRVNASWVENAIHQNGAVHVGIATATDDGLIVPVVHDAARLSLGEIALHRQDLVQRASKGKLRPADIAGGTFTISNLGMYQVDAFNGIVNAPQAAILGVGRIADRVVPVDGVPAVRPMLTLTLSCDHRVVDGARAAQFLDDLVQAMQEPWRLLV